MPQDRAGRPLRGLRVVVTADDELPSLGKALVDLGADVLVLRECAVTPGSAGIAHEIDSRGKRFVDVPTGGLGAALAARLPGADVLICAPTVAGRPHEEVARAHPHLVVAVLTDFGLTGPRRGWVGSEAVYHALGGSLSRSGEPGTPPLLPPGEQFLRSAAQAIAYGIVVAVYAALGGPDRRGAVLDCAIFEAGAVALDPAQGQTGSGTPDSLASLDRPRAGDVYPIYTLADGFVRVSVLARTQWESLLDWMGRPPELAGDDLLSNPGRYAKADLVVGAQRSFFAGMTCDDLVTECRRRRIPAAKVLSIADVLGEPHYRESGILRTRRTADGSSITVPEGMVRIDGVRTAPDPETAAAEPDPEKVAPLPTRAQVVDPHRPLAGVTVLDLGVIVAGAQTGLVLAQQGARVIRIENTTFPDGMRRSFDRLTPALARGHLGKENLGLDLRSPEGLAVFRELVKRADIVTSNFKPGTTAKLGIAHADLAAINPAVITIESSAFGDTGPWRTAMGYGPLVRASVGLTWLWRASPDAHYFGDGVTVYPDHVAARVAATAAVACLLDRARTGRGAEITIAQSDVALVHMAEIVARESLAAGTAQPPGIAPGARLTRTVLPAAGEQQWCVVDPRTDAQLAALRGLVGVAPDAAATDAEQTSAVAAFVATRKADEAAELLQSKGIPAAPMLRPHELPEDAALRERGMYTVTSVAGTDETVSVERYPIPVDGVRPPDLTAAPCFGRHTRAILAELGYDAAARDRLFAVGAAQEMHDERKSQ
ncbi:CoA transferase [Tsukamurella soli]|uniref:CoA transferase n=1 Tax=Tsukamurella soli TaxID=644556 RepID=A0ABP8JMV7_9ACTN